MISKLFSNLVVFLVALGFSYLFVWLGDLMAQGFELEKTTGTVIVLAFFMYMYLKHIMMLKMENRALRMFQDLLKEMHGIEEEDLEKHLEELPVPTESSEDEATVTRDAMPSESEKKGMDE